MSTMLVAKAEVDQQPVDQSDQAVHEANRRRFSMNVVIGIALSVPLYLWVLWGGQFNPLRSYFPHKEFANFYETQARGSLSRALVCTAGIPEHRGIRPPGPSVHVLRSISVPAQDARPARDEQLGRPTDRGVTPLGLALHRPLRLPPLVESSIAHAGIDGPGTGRSRDLRRLDGCVDGRIRLDVHGGNPLRLQRGPHVGCCSDHRFPLRAAGRSGTPAPRLGLSPRVA